MNNEISTLRRVPRQDEADCPQLPAYQRHAHAARTSASSAEFRAWNNVRAYSMLPEHAVCCCVSRVDDDFARSDGKRVGTVVPLFARSIYRMTAAAFNQRYRVKTELLT